MALKMGPRMLLRAEKVEPLEGFYVRFLKTNKHAFGKQMRAFGKAYGFRVKVSQLTPDPDFLSFDLFGKDFYIDATCASALDFRTLSLKPSDSLDFDIRFYPRWGRPPLNMEKVRAIAEDLKKYLRMVPSLSITKSE